MSTMAPIRPALRRPQRIWLTAGPAAAAEARSLVRAAICAWRIPVDPPIAALLTSELVTNAIMHAPGDVISLVISCAGGQLRVDVHDASRSAPELVEAPVDAEAGRGLMLVAGMSTDWGFYQTLKGKAVYFTLACEPRSFGSDGTQGCLSCDIDPGMDAELLEDVGDVGPDGSPG